MKDQEIIDLILRNVRILGYEIIGCSDCPFSEPYRDAFGDDINIADPDEGHYNCNLIKKHNIWGEDPVCTDEDWADYLMDLITEKL